MNKILARIMPFFFLGIFVVLFIVGIVIFSYLLLAGAVVGGILFLVVWLRDKFYPVKKQLKHQGRTFDHEDK